MYNSYRLSAFRRICGHKVNLFLLMLGLALLLVGCGDSPIPAGPPPTPTPSFRQETNQDLFFVMSVPINWAKTSDATSVTFTATEDANLKLSVTTVSASPLTPDSTRILQEKLDSLKAKHPEMRQDNAGFIRLVTDNVSLFKVNYTDNGAEVTEYMAQVNAPSSARAYLLVGRSPTASAEQRRTVFLTSFESFKSNAPLIVPASLTAGAGAGDPTALAANAGGKISGDKTAPGRVTTLVDWQSPALVYGSSRLTVQGLLPQDWQWRIKSFPTLDKTVVTVTPTSSTVANPGLYLTAPNGEAFIQVGVVPNVFRGDAPPSTDEYTKAIDPYLKSFNQSIASQGSRNSISTLENSGAFFRSTFVARNDSGTTTARGVILFRSAGRHLVVGAVTLGAGAATKNNLVEGYDADLQNLVSSIKVTT